MLSQEREVNYLNHNNDKSRRQIDRGDIFYIADDPDNLPVGSELWPGRCGVVISNNGLCHTSPTVTVVWLSTSPNKRVSPTHVQIKSGDKTAMALCESVATVDVSRLKHKIGTVAGSKLSDIDSALMFAMGINRGVSPQGIFKKWEMYMRRYGIETATGNADCVYD